MNFAPTVAPDLFAARFFHRTFVFGVKLAIMSGPWTSPLLDAALASWSTWRAGDLLEFEHVYEDGTSQGSSLGQVRAERPDIGFDVNLFWVEQGDFKNWLEIDTGHDNHDWYSQQRTSRGPSGILQFSPSARGG